MGYTERNWKDASILVCNDVNGTLDIKFSEIKEAIEKDYVVMVKKTVDGVTTFLDVHTINPTERTLKAKGWIYTATSDEAYATGEADESGEGGGGGGGNISIIHFSYNEQTEAWVCDKTYEELNALLANEVVLCGVIVDDGKNTDWFPYEGIFYDSQLSEEYLLFGFSQGYDIATNVRSLKFFSVTENNEVRFTTVSG